MAEESREKSRTRTPRQWLRAAADRVPTAWFAGIGTALFLAATAAFGGLQAVAVPPLPSVAAGDAFAGAGRETTAAELYLTEVTLGTGMRREDDELLLTLIVDVVNTDTQPRQSAGTGSVDAIRLAALPDAKPDVQRVDDGTFSPWLQPQVPARLAVRWVVPASDFRPGETVEIVLPDADKFVGTTVISGEFWSDVRPGATLTMPIDRLEREEAP